MKSQAILSRMNRMEDVKLGDLHQQSKQKGADVCTDTDQWKRTEQPDTKPLVCGYLIFDKGAKNTP